MLVSCISSFRITASTSRNPRLCQLVHRVHQRRSSPSVFLLFSKQVRPIQGQCDILDQWRPGVLPAMGLFMELGLCRVVQDDGENITRSRGTRSSHQWFRFTHRASCKLFLGYVGFPLKGCDSAQLKQHTVYHWLHIVLAKQVIRLFQCHVWFPGAKLVPFLVQVPQCEK